MAASDKGDSAFRTAPLIETKTLALVGCATPGFDLSAQLSPLRGHCYIQPK